VGTGDDVRFTVLRDGRVLDDVEPYLGARGHLVALREGDLSFLHVHPKDDATEGRDIRFGIEYPSQGRYRLFLQFQHDGRVHTAAFTQEVRGDGHRD
jgi:oxalate decarboxylase/phosphoglucose isomerase-like protein (cupin superfamily)